MHLEPLFGCTDLQPDIFKRRLGWVVSLPAPLPPSLPSFLLPSLPPSFPPSLLTPALPDSIPPSLPPSLPLSLPPSQVISGDPIAPAPTREKPGPRQAPSKGRALPSAKLRGYLLLWGGRALVKRLGLKVDRRRLLTSSWGSARAEDARGTPTQSHISTSIF